jgi:hypothetical protein
MHDSPTSNHFTRSRPRFAELLLLSVCAIGVTALSHAADVQVNVEQVIAELRRAEQALRQRKKITYRK